MIGGVGDSGGLTSAAIASARKRHADMLSGLRDQKPTVSNVPANATRETSFGSALSEGIKGLDAHVQRSETLTLDVLKGNIEMHEVSAQLRESRLAFDFAMAVRNKFVEAYREVMRMNV